MGSGGTAVQLLWEDSRSLARVEKLYRYGDKTVDGVVDEAAITVTW